MQLLNLINFDGTGGAAASSEASSPLN